MVTFMSDINYSYAPKALEQDDRELQCRPLLVITMQLAPTTGLTHVSNSLND